MKKILFQTQLTELAKTDVEGLGRLREDDYGNICKWMCNNAATDVNRYGAAFEQFTSVLAGVGKYIQSPDAATGPSTCQVTMPAGSPMTTIGATGSSIGCYGWVMVQGKKKLNVYQAATPAQTKAGCYSALTSIVPATGAMEKPITSVISSSGGDMRLRSFVLANSILTTGVATAVSAICYVRCLP